MTNLTAALDAFRGPALRVAARLPALRDRERRAPALLALHAGVAAVLATLAPSVLLLVGPLVAGVPHIAQDVRQLVIRRAPSRAWRATLIAFCAGLVAVRLAGAPHATEIEAAATAVLLWAAGARLVAALFLGAALASPEIFRIVLVHGHNLVGIGLWLWLFRRRSRGAWLASGAAVAVAALLASGALVPWLVAHGWLDFGGHSVLAAADWLAPGVPGAAGVGMAMSFAFLQSVHYAVWLTCIPLDDAGPRSFRQSARLWRRDLGAAACAGIVILTLLVAGAGLVAPLMAQATYLSLAGFHAYLELVAWAVLAARRR